MATGRKKKRQAPPNVAPFQVKQIKCACYATATTHGPTIGNRGVICSRFSTSASPATRPRSWRRGSQAMGLRR